MDILSFKKTDLFCTLLVQSLYSTIIGGKNRQIMNNVNMSMYANKLKWHNCVIQLLLHNKRTCNYFNYLISSKLRTYHCYMYFLTLYYSECNSAKKLIDDQTKPILKIWEIKYQQKPKERKELMKESAGSYHRHTTGRL